MVPAMKMVLYVSWPDRYFSSALTVYGRNPGMKIYESIESLVGGTPLLKLRKMDGAEKANVLVKLESFNPGFSIKDRVAKNMIHAAERAGLLSPGGTIVEPTSGNTGIGLALIAAARGYKLIITMPDTMSRERIALMRHFGAEVLLTPGAEGMTGAIRKAGEIARDTGAFMPDQFNNPANPEAHTLTTGLEIWNDTEGSVDAFVAAVGTGGTLTGVALALRKLKPSVRIIAVEPEKSPVLSGGKGAPHGIQGIGAGFIPSNCHMDLVDEIIRMSDEEALETAKAAAREEGILCGISAGANIAGALRLTKRPEFAGKNIVTIVCDTGERYLSTALFQ